MLMCGRCGCGQALLRGGAPNDARSVSYIAYMAVVVCGGLKVSGFVGRLFSEVERQMM